VPYANVLILQTQLAANEATVAQFQQRLAQSGDLLATFTGHLPAEWRAADVRFIDLTLPEDLPVSLPSDLVRQRPDILAAEATAHTASANVGVATAAMLPSITLSGTYSANGTTTGSLLSADGRAWNAGANLVAPLFEGGTLWFRRKAAIDNYSQAMALYRQVVLGAFGQWPTPCGRSITTPRPCAPRMRRSRAPRRRCGWCRSITRPASARISRC